jgi:hypothetical protein
MPREPNHRAFRLLVIGLVCGFGIADLAVWAASLLGDGHYPVIAYLVTGVIGGVIGLVLLPYTALARSDGDDDVVVKRRRRGRADTPPEGAEAVDEGRTAAAGRGR